MLTVLNLKPDLSLTDFWALIMNVVENSSMSADSPRWAQKGTTKPPKIEHCDRMCVVWTVCINI